MDATAVVMVSKITGLTPFLEFVSVLVIRGALVTLLAALLRTCDGRALPAPPIWSPNIRHIDARYDRQARRFTPPWDIENNGACFIVRDANGQYVYYENELGR